MGPDLTQGHGWHTIPAMVDLDLRHAREHAGMTQEQLAAESGVSVRTIKRIEAGGRDESSSLGTITKLAGALSINVTDLLTEVAA